ncbi:MAG: response regulator [Planctomycetes bacterium]|nr:response regulator [Planctomycetota bacterium]
MDDHPTNRRILQELLRNWHMTPLLAEEGDSAWKFLEEGLAGKNPVRMILLDANMPGLDGFGFLQRLRADERFRRLPVMMLTSSDRAGDAGRCLEFGVADYMTKPVQQSELLDRILRTFAGVRVEAPVAGAPVETAPVGSLKLLLVEDNIVNQKVALRFLAKAGHKVTVANNGREGIEALARESFDAVLMDLQMPEMGASKPPAASASASRPRAATSRSWR